MKILLIGSGAREHAILKALKKSPQSPEVIVFGKTKNPGMISLADSYELGNIEDLKLIQEIAAKFKPAFAILGPDNPIGLGAADALLELGIKSFGPLKVLAQLESSKSFTRDLVAKYNIEGNPKFKIFTAENQSQIQPYIESELHDDYVVKYDGLIGGKGVKVSGEHLQSIDEGISYALECIKEGGKVVIEEKFVGPEFSLISLTDGKVLAPTPVIQDHKRAYNNDLGPNTGGMGTFSNANHLLPFVTEQDRQDALAITEKVLAALKQETGQTYIGVMYGGFIKTKNGVRLIEFNARFGDPEAMNIFNLLESDFVAAVESCINGTLDPTQIKFKQQASVCVYAVPKGYPDQPLADNLKQITLNKEVFNLEGLDVSFASVDLVSENDSQIVLNLTSSRAIAFTATAETIDLAREKALKGLSYLSGAIDYRTDIGSSELIQSKIDLINSFKLNV
jgi:phosphoribosylamine--glycine ligase